MTALTQALCSLATRIHSAYDSEEDEKNAHWVTTKEGHHILIRNSDGTIVSKGKASDVIRHIKSGKSLKLTDPLQKDNIRFEQKSEEGTLRHADDPAIGAMVSVMQNWLPGVKISEVSPEEVSSVDVSDPNVRKFVYQNDVDKFTRHLPIAKAKSNTNTTMVMQNFLGDVLADAASSVFGLDKEQAKGLKLLFPYKVFDYGGVHHVHDFEDKQMTRLLQELDNPIAVLPQVKGETPGLRVVIGMQDRAIPGSDCSVAVLRYSPAEHGLVCVTVMGRDPRFKGEVGYSSNQVHPLYVDTTRAGHCLALPSLIPYVTAVECTTGNVPPVKTQIDYPTSFLGIIYSSLPKVKDDQKRIRDIIDQYREAYFKGDYKTARERMKEFAEIRGFKQMTKRPRGQKKTVSEFVYKGNSQIRRSDDFVFNGQNDRITKEHPELLGDLKPLDHRFDPANTMYGSGDDAYRHSLVGKSGKIAGWYNRKTGEVKLVKGVADAHTVAHELGWHATFHWAQKNHPALYNTLMKYAQEAPEGIAASVREKYSGQNLSPEALLDEVGAERFTREDISPILNAAKKREAEEWFDDVEKTQDDTRREFVRRNKHDVIKREELDRISSLPPAEAVAALIEAMGKGMTLGTGNDSLLPEGSGIESLIDALHQIARGRT